MYLDMTDKYYYFCNNNEKFIEHDSINVFKVLNYLCNIHSPKKTKTVSSKNNLSVGINNTDVKADSYKISLISNEIYDSMYITKGFAYDIINDSVELVTFKDKIDNKDYCIISRKFLVFKNYVLELFANNPTVNFIIVDSASDYVSLEVNLEAKSYTERKKEQEHLYKQIEKHL